MSSRLVEPRTNGDHGELVAAPAAGGRRSWRSVALPSEHGGWGLTVEPGLLGLLVAPSIAGACLALAAVGAFLARTPLKLVAVDRRRGRTLARTVLTRRVAAGELVAIGLLVAAAVVLSASPFWWPALAAAPLVAVAWWFDVRSRSRRLVPELAGAVGVSSVAAMIVLAGGEDGRLAAAAWVLLAARAATSIPHVRGQIALLHGRRSSPVTMILADAGALVLAAGAVVLDRQFAAGAVALVLLVVVQRAMGHRPVDRAVTVGVRQMVLGFTLVAVAAAGVLVSTS